MSDKPATRPFDLPLPSPSPTTVQRQLIQSLNIMQSRELYSKRSLELMTEFVDFAELHADIIESIVSAKDEQLGEPGSRQRIELFQKGIDSLEHLAEGIKQYFPRSSEGMPQFLKLNDMLDGMAGSRHSTDYREDVSARRTLTQRKLTDMYDTDLSLSRRAEKAAEIFRLFTDAESTSDVSFGPGGYWTVQLAAINLGQVNGNWRAEMLLYAGKTIVGMAQCLSKRWGHHGKGIQIWGQLVPLTLRT